MLTLDNEQVEALWPGGVPLLEDRNLSDEVWEAAGERLSIEELVRLRLPHNDFVLDPLPGERHGVFAARSLHLIQGSSGAGKTTFALQMLKAQAQCEVFFGRQGQGKRYLVIWRDRGEEELQRQLENMGMLDDPPPCVVVEPEMCNLEPAKALVEILQKYQKTGPKNRYGQVNLPEVLLVEGLDMWMRENKEFDHVGIRATNIRNFAQANHLSIIGTLGMPKMKPKEQYMAPRDRAFGSSVWARVADTIVDITVDYETDERHVQVLSRTAKPQRLILTMEDGVLIEKTPAIPVFSVPSIREIRRENGCGQAKAVEIQRQMSGYGYTSGTPSGTP